MTLSGSRGREDEYGDDQDDDEVEVDILAQDEEELDAEMGEARESILEQVRELIDEYVQGLESAAETLAELRLDLAEWNLEDNPYDPESMGHLHQAWHEATNSVRDGYSLVILGIERGQPEFFQTGYSMIEEGVYARDDTFNVE